MCILRDFPLLLVQILLITYLSSRQELDALPPDTDDLTFGNNVYQIRFEQREPRPIFGHKYWFFLKDAVEDVPEYVVHWDNFVECALHLLPTDSISDGSFRSLHLDWRLNTVYTQHTRKNSTKFSTSIGIKRSSGSSWSG